MSLLLHIILMLVIVGVLLYVINRYIPMAASIRTILNAVVVILVILWLLSVLGILTI